MHDLRRLLFYITLIVGLTIIATDVRGQIRSSLFPTPITSEELKEYAAILSLTAAQSQAIEGAFQEYQQACNTIHQQDIPKFSADRKVTFRDPEKQFDIRVQRKFHRRGLAIRAKLVVLDNQFLEQLDSQLSEDQQTKMQHVRMLRERERYRWSIMHGGEVRHETTIDLTRLVKTIDLTAADHKALAPVMQGYDGELTVSVQRYALAQIELIFIYQNPQEHDERRRKAIERGISIIKVNRIWLATMESVLPPQTATKLQDSYRKEVYHGIYPDLENAQRKFESLLDMQQLNDDQKVVISGQRDTYITQHTQLTNNIVALLDEMRLSPDFWMAMRSALVEPLEGLDEVHVLIHRRKKLNSDAAEILSEYFGDGVLRSLRIAAYKEYGSKEKVRLPKRQPRMLRLQLANTKLRLPPTGESPMQAMFSAQRYPPISSQLIQQLSEKLGLTESQRDIVLTLHEQYVIDFMAQRSSIAQEIINAKQYLWARGEDDSFQPPTTTEIRDLHETKLKAISSLKKLDDRFLLDELPSLVQTPGQLALIAAARRAHLRSVYLRRNGCKLSIPGHILGGESELFDLDLLPLLNNIEPPAENLEQFNRLCDSYDEISAKLARQRFSAVHDCKLLADLMLVESFHDGEEYYEFSLTGDSALARQFSAACTNLASAEEQYYQLNLTTPVQLMELLLPESAQLLQDRFRKAAYPDLIDDQQAMHDMLEAALLKPELRDDERKKIVDLLAEYEQEYRALLDQLVAAKRHPRDSSYYRIDDGKVSLLFNSQYGQELQEIAALKFARKEFNASIQRRLDLIFANEDDE